MYFQVDVLALLVENGMAVGLDKTVRAEDILSAIVRVRDDPRYPYPY